MNSARVKILLILLMSATFLTPDLIAQGNKGGAKQVSKQWRAGETFHLKGYDVTLSEPVLVAESKTRHLSMPVISLLANGDLVVVMTSHPDMVVYPNRGVASVFRPTAG